MNLISVPIHSYSFEKKISGLVTKNELGFHFFLEKPNTWIGVKLECNFKKDGIYVIKFNASSKNPTSLLEITIPIGKNRIRVDSFKLTNTETKYHLFVTPFDSKHLSFVYSTFGGFSIGEIEIKNIKVFDMFPINNQERS